MLGFSARLPRTIFTDRGTGMYSPQGFVVNLYEQAVARTDLQLFWGHDASAQAPDMPDLLLHETAVALFRKGMRKAKPVVRPWQETVEQWEVRAASVVASMNRNCKLKKLCGEFPERLRMCVAKDGDRLRK